MADKTSTSHTPCGEDIGKSAGSIFYLCQTEKCDVHNGVTRYQPTPQEQAQRKKEALAERVEKLSRVRVLKAIRKKLPDVLSRPDLEMVALDYFQRLGHVTPEWVEERLNN